MFVFREIKKHHFLPLLSGLNKNQQHVSHVFCLLCYCWYFTSHFVVDELNGMKIWNIENVLWTMRFRNIVLNFNAFECIQCTELIKCKSFYVPKTTICNNVCALNLHSASIQSIQPVGQKKINFDEMHFNSILNETNKTIETRT